MDNGLVFHFEERSVDDLKDYVFSGLRCTDDVMYKLIYILTDLLQIPESYIQIQDSEGVNTFRVCPNELEDSYDDEEVEDNICNS